MLVGAILRTALRRFVIDILTKNDFVLFVPTICVNMIVWVVGYENRHKNLLVWKETVPRLVGASVSVSFHFTQK